MKTRLLPLVFCLAAALPGYSQLFSVGVKGGVPLSDPLNTSVGGNAGATHSVRRYIVGPTAEVHLPFHLSFEVDALYRRLDFQTFSSYVSFPTGVPTLQSFNSAVAANDWQFPFLGKYELRSRFLLRPFLDAGVTYRHVSASSANYSRSASIASGVTLLPVYTVTNGSPVSADNPNTAGFTLGGGVTFKLLFIRLSPEIRYTHWGSNAFQQNYVNSSGNQADFFLGLTF